MLGYFCNEKKIPAWLDKMPWEKTFHGNGLVLTPNYGRHPDKPFRFSKDTKLKATCSTDVMCFDYSEGLRPDDIAKDRVCGRVKSIALSPNGDSWLVPQIYSLQSGCGLPKSVRFDNGRWLEDITGEYADAARWANNDALANLASREFNLDDIWTWCAAYADILRVNYHITIMDVATYGLLQADGSVAQFVDWALDLNAFNMIKDKALNQDVKKN